MTVTLRWPRFHTFRHYSDVRPRLLSGVLFALRTSRRPNKKLDMRVRNAFGDLNRFAQRQAAVVLVDPAERGGR
jgi:hypothetical protein